MRSRHLSILLVTVLLVPVMLVGCSSGSDPGKGGELENIPWKLTNYSLSGALDDVPKDRRSFRRVQGRQGRAARRSTLQRLRTRRRTTEASPSDRSVHAHGRSARADGGGEGVLRRAAEDSVLHVGRRDAQALRQGWQRAPGLREERGRPGGGWKVTGYNNGKEAVVSVVAIEHADDGLRRRRSAIRQRRREQLHDKYETTGSGEIRDRPVASTKMAGPEDLMAQEQEFFAALQASKSYQIRGTTLEMRDASGALQVTRSAGKLGAERERSRLRLVAEGAGAASDAIVASAASTSASRTRASRAPCVVTGPMLATTRRSICSDGSRPASVSRSTKCRTVEPLVNVTASIVARAQPLDDALVGLGGHGPVDRDDVDVDARGPERVGEHLARLRRPVG